MKIEFKRNRFVGAIHMKIDGKWVCGVATEPYFEYQYKSMRDSNVRLITNIIRKELIKKYWKQQKEKQ